MIGWDAADGGTVEALLCEGALPSLGALRNRGQWGRIAGLPGLGDDAAWGSFATGTEPGTHGRFHHRQIVPGTYRLDNFFRDRMSGEAFWARLSRAGRRVAVLDAPKSPLVPGLNGIQLADWLPHGEDGPTPVSSPVALAEMLPERFRPPSGFSCDPVRTSVADLAELCDRVNDHLARRTELALDWLRREPWNFFLAVFAESHCIGHHCWHLHDFKHPAHDPAARAILGNPVRDVLRSLDAALGRLLAACEPDATVIVFSLMTMGTHPMASPQLVDAVLQRLDGGTDQARGRAWSQRILGVWRGRQRPAADGAPDPSTRSAFGVHTNSVASGIRVNLVGREPRGRISAQGYDGYCRFLAASFEALVDPASGRRLVSEVVRVAERYPGPRAAEFADLLIVWNADAPISAAASAAIGVVRESATEPPGNHQPGGWFVAAGPEIAPGEAARPAALVDFAPTAAVILGVDAAGLAGTPMFAGDS